MDAVNFDVGDPVTVPTLIVLGENALDRTVPTEISRRYCALIPHAEVRTLNATGHLGTVTRPVSFANEVSAFVDRAGADASRGPHQVAM